jgi:hypothetical protein
MWVIAGSGSVSVPVPIVAIARLATWRGAAIDPSGAPTL